MATTNYERVGRALELLKEGLRPFVERELKASYGENWRVKAAQVLRQERERQAEDGAPHFDVQALFTLMWFQWAEVFNGPLGHAERSLVSELRDVRNRWAHQQPFSGDDAYRALDSAGRLLAAIAAPQAAEVDRQKQELLRVRFEEQARRETRKAAVAPVEGHPAAGLRPWREVMTPHPDVASGRYQQAEFAADLFQVHQGEGSDEYRLPQEFFRRTYVTEGLRRLLTNALRRLSGLGGDPVVELQTNFGGGKTHTLLALYHLFSDASAHTLPGAEPLLREVSVDEAPVARRVVLGGIVLSPGQSSIKPDGTRVCTMWGELAWQLGGAEGYATVAEADARAVSPGSEALRALFERAAPCLVLIDEWLAFVRQTYNVDGLSGGSFDANISFAQALTEAARQTTRTLVVASIPASDNEIGGEGGRMALERLKNVFSRVESSWRPASAEEGFEIVRRRLFQPITDPTAYAARDAVVRAFAQLYQAQAPEFPQTTREGAYQRRLEAAYPIHPELFDRLYNDWSTLDKFQRTRGVLRLMAAVIHELWERQDGALLILPASIPIDAPAVQNELTRYVEDTWAPVIEKDVDGPHSLPLALDRDNPNLGRYSACRRVARTLYLGSAPTLNTSRRGLDDRAIKLGCVQPGESVGTFGDALRRLTDEATHLYVDAGRYWLSTQPSVTRLAQDRAAQQDQHGVWGEIVRRLKAEEGRRGDFTAVHTAPASSADVADEMGARLVVLGPIHTHTARMGDSAARREAETILNYRGTGARRFRNMLAFLAPDKARLADLEQGVRQYLAWASIERDRDALNLDPFQSNQARLKRDQANEVVQARLHETYAWALVPTQPDPQGNIEWQDMRLQGQDPLLERAGRKHKGEEALITDFAATRLRLELDRVLWADQDHLGLRTLREYLARYLYLPRLRDADVLLETVRRGMARSARDCETFAYAERWDEASGRYVGLVAGHAAPVVIDDYSVLVRPEAALRQLEADEARRREMDRQQGQEGAAAPYDHAGSDGKPANEGGRSYSPTSSSAPGSSSTGAPTPAPRRFHGTVMLNDPLRMGRDAGRIAEEIVQHLGAGLNATVRVTLEIDADLPDGAPEQVIYTVTENCRTLKFISHNFEED